VYFLSKKDPIENTFSPIQKLFMKLVLEYQDSYGKTFFYMSYGIFFLSYLIEKFTVDVCFSLFMFIT
jgi:CubicO group peptidase (beta-lactamase class C family)